ncbi:ester cyclase [Candidatus Latescibacterota bacterium]
MRKNLQVFSFVFFVIIAAMMLFYLAVNDQQKATNNLKDSIRLVFHEVYTNGNLDIMDEHYAEDYIYHHPPEPDIKGLEDYKTHVGNILNFYSDGEFTIDEIIVDGDVAAVRWTTQGTMTGTEKQVKFTGCEIIHYDDGKAVEEWHHPDELGLMQQLGFKLSPPTGAQEAAIRREYEEAWNKGTVDVLDGHIADNFIRHNPPNPDVVGPDALKQYILSIPTLYSSFTVNIDEIIAHANKTVTRFSVQSTLKGAATKASTTGIAVDHWENGKIIERWVQMDTLGYLTQQGYKLVPPKE